MDWNWVWQNVFSSALWEVLLVLGGGAVLAIIKRKLPDLAPSILYGIGGAACIAVILFTLTGRAILSKEKAPTLVTSENVETSIRTWLDTFGYSVKKRDDPTTYFTLDVVLPDGNGYTIMRRKARERYLTFGSNILIVDPQKARLGKLSKEQTAELAGHITLDMARSGFQKPFTVAIVIPNQIFMTFDILITSNLDENDVITATSIMDNELVLARESLAVNANRLGIPFI